MGWRSRIQSFALVAALPLALSLAGSTDALALDGSTQQTLINQDRASAGLAPLAWSPCLWAVALQNAQRMAAQGYISHANGVQLDLACSNSSTQSGENVAYISSGIDDVEANTLFMNSAPHRANILGPYTLVATAWALDQSGQAYIAEEFLEAPVPSNTNLGAAVCSWAPGRLDVFVRGADNALWHRWYQGGWSRWESLGGVLASDPACVSWGSGRLDVFVQGTDNALWHLWYSGGWSSWETLGGQLTSAPAGAAWTAGRLDIFARLSDGSLGHRWYQGGWSHWESLGGTLTSSPAAASWGLGRLDVFVRGSANELEHRSYAGSWSAWESLAGVLGSAPAAASWGPGRIDVFATGSADRALWHIAYSGTWGSWQSLGSMLGSAPSVASWSSGRLDVFARAVDGTVGHLWFQSGWQPWEFWPAP
jgi:hypothetical protein